MVIDHIQPVEKIKLQKRKHNRDSCQTTQTNIFSKGFSDTFSLQTLHSLVSYKNAFHIILLSGRLTRSLSREL